MTFFGNHILLAPYTIRCLSLTIAAIICLHAAASELQAQELGHFLRDSFSEENTSNVTDPFSHDAGWLGKRFFQIRTPVAWENVIVVPNTHGYVDGLVEGAQLQVNFPAPWSDDLFATYFRLVELLLVFTGMRPFIQTAYQYTSIEKRDLDPVAWANHPQHGLVPRLGVDTRRSGYHDFVLKPGLEFDISLTFVQTLWTLARLKHTFTASTLFTGPRNTCSSISEDCSGSIGAPTQLTGKHLQINVIGDNIAEKESRSIFKNNRCPIATDGLVEQASDSELELPWSDDTVLTVTLSISPIGDNIDQRTIVATEDRAQPWRHYSGFRSQPTDGRRSGSVQPISWQHVLRIFDRQHKTVYSNRLPILKRGNSGFWLHFGCQQPASRHVSPPSDCDTEKKLPQLHPQPRHRIRYY